MPDETTWEEARRELIERSGDGMVEEEVWKALKQLENCSKVIVELGAEAAKLARKAYPGQENTASRQAIEAFFCALELKLALEVQKLCYHTSDDVIVAALRIKPLQKECLSHNMDSLVPIFQDKLRAICKELKESEVVVAEKAVRVTQPSTVQLAAAASVSCLTKTVILRHNAPFKQKCWSIGLLPTTA